MKNQLLLIISLTLLFAFAPMQNDNKNTFKKLSGLEGTWAMPTKRGTIIIEEWKKVDDNYLQSRGMIIKGTDTIITERVALRNTEAGIFYTSTVDDQNNKQPVPFKLSSENKNAFVFENAEHDFPKRIVYELISADSLHAYVDGGVKEPNKRQGFYSKCCIW